MSTVFCGTQVEDAGVCPGMVSKIGAIFTIFRRLEITISNSPATNFSAFRSDRITFVGLYLQIFNETSSQELITCTYFLGHFTDRLSGDTTGRGLEDNSTPFSIDSGNI